MADAPKQPAQSQQERAAHLSERLRAAKSEVMAASPEPPPAKPLSLKPLWIGSAAILLLALIWMSLSRDEPSPPNREAAASAAPVGAKNSVAAEAARQARERVNAAEQAAREARARRAAMEAEFAAQRQREAELARQREADQAAALAAQQQEVQRQALREQQRRDRQRAEERAAQQERQRQVELTRQREQERVARQAAAQARAAELAAEQEQQRLAAAAAEAAQRRRQAEKAAAQAAAHREAAAKVESLVENINAEPTPATIDASASEQAPVDITDAFRHAKPGASGAGDDEAQAQEAEFSSDPCKGPSAKFLSTCR